MLTICVNAETFLKISREREESYCKHKCRRAPAVRAFVTKEQQEDSFGNEKIHDENMYLHVTQTEFLLVSGSSELRPFSSFFSRLLSLKFLKKTKVQDFNLGFLCVCCYQASKFIQYPPISLKIFPFPFSVAPNILLQASLCLHYAGERIHVSVIAPIMFSELFLE